MSSSHPSAAPGLVEQPVSGLSAELEAVVRAAGGEDILLDARRGKALVRSATLVQEVCKRLRNAGFTRCLDLSCIQLPQGGDKPATADGAAAETQLAETEPDAQFQFTLLLRHPRLSHCLLQLKWKYTQTARSYHPSLSRIWPSAGLAEREVWEMFGVAYTGHDNLVPLLLDAQFPGHPLRHEFSPPAGPTYAAQELHQRHERALLQTLMQTAPLAEADARSGEQAGNPFELSAPSPGGDAAEAQP